jgi:hypothetical protein
VAGTAAKPGRRFLTADIELRRDIVRAERIDAEAGAPNYR